MNDRNPARPRGSVRGLAIVLRRRLAHALAVALPALLAVALPAAGGRAAAAEPPHGERIYHAVCIGCHQIGVLGAPKFGDAAAWGERLQKGLDTLAQHALNGFGKMPPKGGNPNLNEADVRAAIQFMAGTAIAAGAKPGGAAGGLAAARAAAPLAAAGAAVTAAETERGAEIVKRVCKGCHEIGVLGAPKIGRKADWEPRLKKGEATLVQNATRGIGNMPPKGGAAELTAGDLRAAIRYMSNPPATAAATAVAAAPGAPAAPAAPSKAAIRPQADVNRFNRLLRPASEHNPPPPEDGIHDPANNGTSVLQPPRTAFEAFPKSSGGNYVDWVKALKDGAINPRWDLGDPAKTPLVMDLNIVREVKGSMPDVVYPHQQHLQWLDCSNCHPAIFIPQKGANQISMAEILLGRKCGVCHGKVAFPVSECRKCHSKKKTDVARN